MKNEQKYDELLFYIENNTAFQSKVVVPFTNKLLKTIKKDTYHYSFSLSIWSKIVKTATKEFLYQNGLVSTYFPSKMLKELAKDLADDFEEEHWEEIDELNVVEAVVISYLNRS